MKFTLLFSIVCMLLALQYLAYQAWQGIFKMARVNPEDSGILPLFLFAMLCGAVTIMLLGLSTVIYLWLP